MHQRISAINAFSDEQIPLEPGNLVNIIICFPVCSGSLFFNALAPVPNGHHLSTKHQQPSSYHSHSEKVKVFSDRNAIDPGGTNENLEGYRRPSSAPSRYGMNVNVQMNTKIRRSPIMNNKKPVEQNHQLHPKSVNKRSKSADLSRKSSSKVATSSTPGIRKEGVFLTKRVPSKQGKNEAEQNNFPFKDKRDNGSTSRGKGRDRDTSLPPKKRRIARKNITSPYINRDIFEKV